MAGEIHTLNDSWMERRSAGEDSLRALRGTAERMYCQIVLAANNAALPPMWTPRRFLTYLRWAWLIEGAAQYFTGQTSLFRAAVITRLREGERPALPADPPRRPDPGRHGLRPARPPRRARRLRADGLAAAPRRARGATWSSPSRRGCGEIERAWRAHLDEILYPQSDSLDAPSLSDALERPDLDLDLGSPPEFSFDPTTAATGSRQPNAR